MYAKHYLSSLVVGCALLVVVFGIGGCDRDSRPKANTSTPPAVPSAEDMAATRDKAIAAAKAATQKSAPATQPTAPADK
jgi:hypothetical protein